MKRLAAVLWLVSLVMTSSDLWAVTIEWLAPSEPPESERRRSSTDDLSIPLGLPGRFWSLSDVLPASVTAAAL